VVTWSAAGPLKRAAALFAAAFHHTGASSRTFSHFDFATDR